MADLGSGLDDGGGDPGPEGWVVGFQDGGWDCLCHRVDEGGRQPSAAGAGDGLLVRTGLAEPGVNQRIINCLSV